MKHYSLTYACRSFSLNELREKDCLPHLCLKTYQNMLPKTALSVFEQCFTLIEVSNLRHSAFTIHQHICHTKKIALTIVTPCRPIDKTYNCLIS